MLCFTLAALTPEQWAKLGAGLFASIYGLSHLAGKITTWRAQRERIREQQAQRDDRRATAAEAVLTYQLKTEISFRNDLLTRIGRLEAKDTEQQALIDRQQTTIDNLGGHVQRLELDLNTEKQAKHDYRNQLNVAALVIGIYRKKHGRAAGDTFEAKFDQQQKPKTKEHDDEA